jgi:hypothetical protein
MKFIEKEYKRMLKKKILMGFSSLCIAMICWLTFSACGVSKKAVEKSEVTFEVVDVVPHCGGAAPDPELAYPMIQPAVNYQLWVYKTDEKGKRGAKVGELRTNEEGMEKMMLAPGKYQLWKPTKIMTFENFKKTESGLKDKMYKYKDDECFKKWQSTPDYSFDSNLSSSVRVVYTNRCNVGAHPCLEYTGPVAP